MSAYWLFWAAVACLVSAVWAWVHYRPSIRPRVVIQRQGVLLCGGIQNVRWRDIRRLLRNPILFTYGGHAVKTHFRIGLEVWCWRRGAYYPQFVWLYTRLLQDGSPVTRADLRMEMQGIVEAIKNHP